MGGPNVVMVMEPVVSVEWLAEHLEDPDVRVFDATINADRVLGLPRIRNGRRDYDRAHIPGMVRLGRPDVAVYDGGLVEWCADRSLPLERAA